MRSNLTILKTGVFIFLCILTYSKNVFSAEKELTGYEQNNVVNDTTQAEIPPTKFIPTIFENNIKTNTYSYIQLILIIAVFLFIILIKTKRTILEDKKFINEANKAFEIEKEQMKKFSMIIEQNHDAIMITDAEGKVEYVNDKFIEATGYTSFEILGQSSRVVQPKWIKEENEEKFLQILESGGAWRSEVHFKKKNGEDYWAFESVSFIKDVDGKVTHYLSTHRDISREHELSEKLSFQASHDELTGLFNRREFEKKIDNLLTSAERDKAEHVLCYIDLDSFKVVNDTCGHVAGDELLRQLGSLFTEIVSRRDMLARLGGDEFAILFKYCSLDNAHRITSSILNALQNFQFSWEGRSFKIGASIGLVEIKETMFTKVELLKAADTACYMAKDSGRNRIQIYHAEDSCMQQRQGEMVWVTKINEALDEDLFCLYAQIIVPTNSNDIHYEFLIRMQDKGGGVIPPGAFLASAERYHLMSKLDRWVIGHAFEFLAGNEDFQEKINFCSINLSGQSLTEEGFLEFVIDSLEKYNLRGDKICFEITETAAISSLNKAVNFISALKEKGCMFALDDFGSGLSSFGYLKNLSVDFLKIDGMFVKDIVDDPIDHAMVKSINEIGHVMGMKTIAEFVENNEIKSMLAELNVDYVQGYGIGKPLPLDELLEENANYNLVSNY